tara:strand:- start:374 stop:832 length:459 start_codon:yes stop_codon:yes gene_type:complete
MPKEIVLIAAVTVDGYIARHSLEVTKWSRDLELFKHQTMGNPVIMGSNTYKTLSKELVGRDTIVLNRKNKPEDILNKITSYRCFIIGGGKTYYRFSSFLTHIYITPHPVIFGKGVPLFDGENLKEIDLSFERIIEHDRENGIFQYQYKVMNK